MLNTLKTNLILTRAALIALFAGLFILAACGGGSKAAAPTTTGNTPNICDTNPFGATCTRAADATARTMQISDCATSIDTDASDRDCDFVPLNVIYCLEDPLLTAGSTACDATAYDTARQGSGVTLATVTDTRRNLCRGNADRNNNKLCTNTIVENCGDDSNPFDLLCGRLNPARNAIIEICVDSATLADSTKNADCLAARTAGFTCFDNPWAESCVTSTMYREFASFRANAQASRLTYCMDDDADSGVCGSALARVCSASGDGANPFSDLCTGANNTYDSVRADFATNCFNRKATDNDVTDCTVTAFEVPRTGTVAECDGEGGDAAKLMPDNAKCMATPVTVQTCVQAPFSTNCRPVDTFDNTRSALLDICTNGVPDAKDFFCGTTNGGFKADEATCIDNPFTPDVTDGINCGTLFTALGTTVKTAQDNLIAGCTGADADGMNTRCDSGIAGAEVAACLANPFDAACDTTLGSETQATTAQNNIISLCTGTDASVATNTLCTGLTVSANNVKACIDNPFFTAVAGDACTVALGSAEAVTLAQSNLIEVCTGADADGVTNSRCGSGVAGTDVAACLADPFGATCATELGDGAMTAQNNLIALCIGTDAINTPNQRCSGIISDSDVQTCLDNPFTTTGLSGSVTCATALGGANIVMAAQNNLIEVCTRANADSLTSRCFSAVSGCLADPFGATCDTELGATQAMTARSNLIELCSVGNPASQSSVLCVGLRNTSAGTCINDPFTPNVADGSMNDINCETILGTTVLATLQDEVYDYCSMAGDDRIPTTCINLVNNVICLGTNTNSRTNPFDTRCEDVANIDTPTTGARAMFCGLGTNNADIPACTDTVRATCIATPFASECYADGNPYDLHRAQAILACAGVPKDDRATSDLCMDVEIKAEVPVSTSNPTLIEAVTLIDCVGDLFNGDCAAVVFAPARGALATACRDSGDRDMEPACDVVVKAEVPVSDSNPLIPAVTVEDCVDQPFSADCASDVFENTRFLSAFQCGLLEKTARADSVCEQVIVAAGSNPETDPAVTVATCVDNPFASACQTLEDFSFERILLVQDCTNGVVNLTTGMIDSVATDAACATTIGDTSTTISDCNTDPFQADCETLNAFESTRCTSNPFYTECLGNDVYANDRCEARPFGADCVDHDTYDSARDDSCTSPTASNYNVFNVNCTEDDYTGTDAARKTIADGCRAGTTTTGCDAVVSDATGAPTIAMCNTNPYATGCDATVFADALTAYCADGADTIFNTNCDSRTGIATVRSVAIGECIAALTTDKTDASCTGREIVAGEEEVTAIIAGTTMIDHDNNPDTPDIVARAEDARAGVPAIPAVTVGSCLDDPFHTGCTSDLFDFARADHMEVCMSNGNANLPSCATLATAEPCVRNPFLASCMTATVGNRFKNARVARYAFCEGSRAGSAASVATGDTDLCGIEGTGGTGTTVRGEICSYAGGAEGERLNPFAGVCADNTYVSSKKYYCGVGGRRASDDNCNDIVADNSINTADGCLANPFSASCTGYTVPSTGATITEELRTFLTMQRTAYCTAVDAEGFDATLCQTADTTDADFASTVCAGLGEDGNPFAPFCVRDNNEFDADRVTFVEACAALTGGATELTTGATCSAEVIACNTGNGLTANCIDEPAYASLRQTTIIACNDAVIEDARDSTTTATALCAGITAAGYLECVTTNPYLNRAADAGAGVTALDCIGNADYAGVRDELEGACATTGGTRTTDTRCPVLLAGVCGTGTTASDAVAGTNPFDSRFCTTDNAYDAHRKAVIDSCDGSTVTESCTAEINACITSPFNTVVDDGVTTDCTVASYADALVDRRITYCGTGATSGNNSDEANISLPACQTFAATTILATNPCVANPFGEFETGVACDATHVGGDIMAARALRTTYCSGLGTSSAGIRADSGNPNALCLGAVEAFCVAGDAQFATGTNDNEFNCLTDDTYNTARETHYDACILDETARTTAGTDCTNAMAEICTTPTGLQTNPFAPICSEGGADASAEQLAVITNCKGLNADLAVNIRCKRTDVATILTACVDDPRDAACDDYAADAGEPFNSERVELYVSSCAGDEALTNGDQAAFCPEAAVKAELCLETNGANARPFAPICTQTSVTPNLASTQGLILQICVETANDNDDRCMHSQANAAVIAVRTSCNATTGDPFATARPITATGVTATTFNCSTQNQFEVQRVSYTAACKTGSVPTVGTCTGDVITRICTKTAGANADPFNGLCDAITHETYRTTFANLCVDATTNSAALDGATCPTAVVNCATNPFGSLCADVAYNGQKTVVLDLCQAALTTTKVGTPGTNTRCVTAISQVNCLKDPIKCDNTAADTQFAQASGSGTASVNARAYRDTVRNNRVAYCVQSNNLNTQTAICRTAATSGIYAFCMQNPFASGCATVLNNNVTGVRTTRLSYCRGLNVTDIAAGSQINDFTVSRSDDRGVLNLCFVNDGFHADAVAEICYGTGGSNADKSRDPFTAVCQAFPAYDARRAQRLLACANANTIGTTTTTVNSVAAGASPTLSCNWARQVTYCANDTAALNAQCGTLNTAMKWKDNSTGDYAPVELTNLGAGDANEFVTDTALDTTFEYLDTAGAVSATPVGAAISYGPTFPSVTAFSARKKAVFYTCADDHVPHTTDTPVVECSDDLIRLSDTETKTSTDVKTPAGEQRFYARINAGNVGRPVFNRNNPAATWNGRIQWIGNGIFAGGTDRSNFQMKVDFAARTIQGAVPITAGATTGDHLVIDGTYTGAGIISGSTSLRDYTANPNADSDAINIGATINGSAASEPGFVSGIIGHRGAVGAFISNTDSNANGYAGGFIVCSAVTNATCRP